MNSLEQQLIDVIHTLNEDQQEQLLGFSRILQQTNTLPGALGQLLQAARQSRAELCAKYGDTHFDTPQMLRDLRDETCSTEVAGSI